MKTLGRKTKWSLFIASFGIVPFYVAPFVVLTLLVRTDLSPVEVSLFPATMMLAQLLVVSFLPFAANGVDLKRVGQATFSISIFMLALAAFLEISVPLLMLLGFSIGISSGVLFYFGTTVALDSEERFVAFLTRLSFSLLWAGSIVSIFVFVDGANLPLLFVCLLLVYAFLVVAIPSWHIQLDKAESNHRQPLRAAEFLPLALVFLFFLGQTGFYSFHAAIKFTEITPEILQLSISRIVAAAILLTFLNIFLNLSSLKAVAALVILEIGAILLFNSSANALIVFTMIVVYEISLNLVSSRLQAATGQLAPIAARRFLSPVVISATILGPLFFGGLISMFSDQLAILVTVATCTIPFLTCVLALLIQQRAAQQ